MREREGLRDRQQERRREDEHEEGREKGQRKARQTEGYSTSKELPRQVSSNNHDTQNESSSNIAATVAIRMLTTVVRGFRPLISATIQR